MVRIRIVCESDPDHNREFDVPEDAQLSMNWETCTDCKLMVIDGEISVYDPVIAIVLLDMLAGSM